MLRDKEKMFCFHYHVHDDAPPAPTNNGGGRTMPINRRESDLARGSDSCRRFSMRARVWALITCTEYTKRSFGLI